MYENEGALWGLIRGKRRLKQLRQEVIGLLGEALEELDRLGGSMELQEKLKGFIERLQAEIKESK